MEGMDTSYRRPSQVENSSCSERIDKGGGCQDSTLSSNDIHARLPLDPFGMNVKLITGWIADFPDDGLDFIGDRAMMFGAHSEDMEFDEKSYPSCSFEGWMEKELGDGECNSGYLSFCNLEEFLSFSSSQDTRVAQTQTTECEEGTGSCSFGDGGSSSGDGGSSSGDGGAQPNDALYYALSYLGVRDLLSVERVCKSLQSAVQDDNLLWRTIHIDPPLSSRIGDDALLQLANRAKGNLQCLSLVSCLRITNDGLSRVLKSNPKLEKLSVPGCTRLTVDGIVNDLKILKSSGAPGLMHLRLGRRYDVTPKQFDELKLLLTVFPKAHKPRFFHDKLSSFSCDDGRESDIEMCPRCNNLRFVYDCPAKDCQGKSCRACSFCIARCIHCGICIVDNEYEETFCLDMLCVECWKNLFQGKQEENDSPFEHNIFYQGTTYHLRLFG